MRFSTYLGGTYRDGLNAVSLAPDGSIAVAGFTESNDLPEVGGLDLGSEPDPDWPDRDGWIARLSADGREIVQLTTIGGSATDHAWALVHDAAGRLHVGGRTRSPELAAAAGRSLNDGSPCTSSSATRASEACSDAFLLTLEPDGTLARLETLGGSAPDGLSDLAIGPAGRIHAVGWTRSSDFPTRDAWQDVFPGGELGGFVARFDPDTLELLTSTYVAPLRPDEGDALALVGVAVDPDGRSHVVGHGHGSSVTLVDPTQAPVPETWPDAFIGTLSADGTSLDFATWHGGTLIASDSVSDPTGLALDYGSGIGIDGAGARWIVGDSSTRDMPVVNALQPEIAEPDDTTLGFARDGFLLRLTGNVIESVREPSALDLRLVPPVELRPMGTGTLVGFEETMGAESFRLVVGSLQSLWQDRTYDHAPLACALPGSGAVVDLPSGGVYVLVQAEAAGKRSSLGRDSTGVERGELISDCP